MNMTLNAAITAAREYLDPRDVDCVVYHSPCNDGSGAAVAAWLALGAKPSYIRRVYYKDFVVEDIKHKNVIVIDAMFKTDELLHLRSFAKKLMILDHHDTAMKELSDLPGCFFTMENSGAVLGWHYFHGLDKPAPDLLRLIEDRDLWRWSERDRSEPLYYALRERYPNTEFKKFLPYVEPDKLQELIDFGRTLVEANHKWCEEAAESAKARTFTLPGENISYKIMCREVNSDRLISELSDYLMSKFGVDFVMLWIKSGEQYKVSFRSSSPAINVGAIASALGGGGHKQAAGAVLYSSPWDLTK